MCEWVSWCWSKGLSLWVVIPEFGFGSSIESLSIYLHFPPVTVWAVASVCFDIHCIHGILEICMFHGCKRYHIYRWVWVVASVIATVLSSVVWSVLPSVLPSVVWSGFRSVLAERQHHRFVSMLRWRRSLRWYTEQKRNNASSYWGTYSVQFLSFS